MNSQLDKLAKTVSERLLKYGLKGRTLTLKIKYSDFRQITRNKSFLLPVNESSLIAEAAKQLLEATDRENKRIRLLGISISNFGDALSRELGTGQLNLFA
jgi:DNA polymerase-4